MPLMTKHGERDPPPLLHNTTTSSSPPPHQHHNTTTTTTYNIMGGGGAGGGGGLGLLPSLAAVSANNNNNNNNNNNLFGLFPPPSSNSSTSSHHQHQLPHLLLHLPPAQDHLQPHSQSHAGENINQQEGIGAGEGCYFMDDNMSNSGIKAKIMAHPHYPRLLAAYVNCHKVGAPAEVVAQLEQTCASEQAAAAAAANSNNNVNNDSGSSSRGSMGCNIIGEDPALDQFMEAYCEMLTKYEQELTKPIKEAMLFINRVESQFKALTLSSSSTSHSGFAERVDRSVSSDEDEVDANDNCIDPQAEERELKDQLLRRYSGYLGSLKQEFLKKRKKGKLPKEARQQLLDWWSRHYKWPYPSESQKLALAESTGLDQKQINNWFINQRKRHWKPSEEMQFVVMDASHPHYYMEDIAGHPHFPMDCTPMLL